MKAYVTRDSVSAGDDVLAPHAREVRIHAEPTMRDLVDQALKISQLPRISGGKATWALSSSIPLAVVAQEWDEPELVSQFPLDLGLLDHSNDEIRMHWSYFAQLDPDTVLEVLRRLRLHAE